MQSFPSICGRMYEERGCRGIYTEHIEDGTNVPSSICSLTEVLFK